MMTPSGGYHHSYFIHFYFCGGCSWRSSFQFNKTCLYFLSESDRLRQRIVHNITKLSISRNFFPRPTVLTHKEFDNGMPSSVLPLPLQGAYVKLPNVTVLPKSIVNGEDSHLFPSGARQVIPVFFLCFFLQRFCIVSGNLTNVSSQPTFAYFHPELTGVNRGKTQHTLISDCRAFYQLLSNRYQSEPQR